MNTKNNETRYVEEDTIDLRELWATLMKHKKLIVVITALITALAVVYIVLAKPIYEVKAVISLAKINGETVDNPNDLKYKLDYMFKDKQKIYPKVSEVSLPKHSDIILVVKAQGYTNKDAITKVNEVVDFIVKSENKDIMDYIELQKNSILNNMKRVHQLEQRMDTYRKKVSNYEKEIISLQKKDAVLAAIFAIEIGKQEAKLNEMQKTKTQLLEYNDGLEYSISEINLKKAKRVGEVQVLDYPVKPKKTLIVTVAFITGLILSVFLAFFLEFIQGAKRVE